MMKRNSGYLVASLLILVSISIAGEHVRTFHGEISDSGCAMNVHSLTRSHQEMLKSKGIGGTSTACATHCAKKMGGEFVLKAGDDVYHLDNQAEVEKFAGQRVKVSGTLDTGAKLIHVATAEAEK